MKEALVKNRELAIRSIMAAWPGPVLVLRDLVPELFTSLLPLYNPEYLAAIVRQGLRYTTSLAHAFLDTLKANANSRLRFLDLTGFPTAEVMVYFVATHCMLAHNEVRHEAIRTMFEHAQQQSDSHETASMDPVEPMDHCLPPDCSVTIKLDAFVTSESTHTELSKALKVSSFENRKLTIVIGRLAVTCLGQARITLLLQQVHPQFLTGLQLQYNALTVLCLVKMAPTLKTLVSLESLDLSCNSIVFQSEAACQAAADVFAAMPRLHRLDLSNNRIKTRLRRLLDPIQRPLTFLRLAGCSLTVTDLVYLSHSQHSGRLEELDLSENNLTACCTPLKEVLLASCRTLCVLELEDCHLQSVHMDHLTPGFPHLSALLLLNLSQSHLTADCLLSVLTTAAQLPSLQMFKASYCVDCYTDQGQEDQRKASVLAQLNSIANSNQAMQVRGRPLTLFLSELERVLDTE
ncbi:leucine-rich repeat-containing protein 14-like isoform X3 [Babylonia areolata]